MFTILHSSFERSIKGLSTHRVFASNFFSSFGILGIAKNCEIISNFYDTAESFKIK
jgi:hypothetical protein